MTAAAAAAGRTRKHLLDFRDWSDADIAGVFETARAMSQVMTRTIKKVPALQGFTIGLLFFEDSTRTRLSFDRAARAQSADVISFSAGGSSLSKGESLRDTIETINAMQADLYVVRHAAAGAAHQLSRWTDASIVNAGDGRRAHPTQALLDVFTFMNRFPGADSGLKGKKLAIVGDVTHSRVARSSIELWTRLGASVTVCGPRTLLPLELAGTKGLTITESLSEAVEGAHAVMALRLQRERMQAGLLPSFPEYVRRWQVTTEAMKLADRDALVMHPGPMNRDLEIEGRLADSERSVILDQVSAGVPVRMAVLYTILVGSRRPAGNPEQNK